MLRKKFCSIYLFRHGQTYFNRDKRFTGWKDSRLTPLGKRQAEKIARMLKGKRVDAAFQTRLSRSKDTLRPVLRFHPECKEVITDDRMIERSYGKLQGKHHSTIEKNLGKAMLHTIRRSYGTSPPGGESVKMVEKRVLAFLKDLLKKIKKEKVNVAISAHGNSMRPFRRYFEKLTIPEMMQLENPWDDYFEYKVRV
ncbi:histidine phosphatase family protein [Candidatus Woesearchaeota archaeon]|nr:histidine phosphatase family protein [Candidatus Woesearchaeota archaeon]